MEKNPEHGGRAAINWKSFFDAIPHPAAVLGQDHSILAANRKLCELLNRSASEICGRKCWEVLRGGEHGGNAAECPLEAILSSQSIKSVEMEIKAWGGWYLVACAPVLDETEASGRVLLIAVDMTERKRAEEQLKESLREYQEQTVMFETMFDAIPDVIGLQDSRHGIIRYNKAGYAFLNRTAEEVKGKTCYQLIGRDKPCDLCATSEVYRTKKPARLERYSPETSRWFDIRAYPVMDSHGNVSKVIEHLRDITDMKRYEEQVAAMERHLQQAERLESLGVLAGGIAHDFNNLLGGIYGYIDIARTHITDPTVREYLDIALNTMDRARSLTQQLLTFAKGGSPDKRVRPLDSFLRETARFVLSGSKASLRFSCDPDLWACAFDANQMAQVIDNILINALQAMPAGGTISIRASNRIISTANTLPLPPGRYVEITVSDTGIGIPESIRGRIFDPFFTTKQQGSGLGLAIAYSIVKKHGGYITVDSEPGKGSTFSILLPAATESDDVHEEPRHAVPKERRGRILIMDDEKVIRDAIATLLRNSGFDPVVCEDGRSAIACFEKSVEDKAPFIAIILDLTVPGGVGGKEAGAVIRKSDASVPIFVTSGYSDDPIMQHPEEYGFNDSIQKPFVLSELMDMLWKHL